MNSGRIEQLQKFLDEDRSDPFNWYALALEFVKSDQQKALTLFEKLLNDFPEYIPTYYHAGHLYLELGEHQKAVDVFERGITLAKKQNDVKSTRELKSALDELMF